MAENQEINLEEYPNAEVQEHVEKYVEACNQGDEEQKRIFAEACARDLAVMSGYTFDEAKRKYLREDGTNQGEDGEVNVWWLWIPRNHYEKDEKGWYFETEEGGKLYVEVEEKRNPNWLYTDPDFCYTGSLAQLRFYMRQSRSFAEASSAEILEHPMKAWSTMQKKEISIPAGHLVICGLEEE